MKRFLLAIATVISFCACSREGSRYDLNAPFGWATCTSRDDAGSYRLTGGAADEAKGIAGSSVTLVSDGTDMREAVQEALRNYDIVILDGSNGDFIISSTVDMIELSHKTIVGINGACMRSQFEVTQEMLDTIKHAPGRYRDAPLDSDGMYTLSNGFKMEKRKYNSFAARQAMIDLTGDLSEQYAHSGMFNVCTCEDIIIRNLTFRGTGAIKGLADHMIRVRMGTSHVWIDHCHFIDPTRCSICLGSASDFVTVSWCRMQCTPERNEGRQTYGMLIASGDDTFEDEGHLNCTLAFNQWDNVWTRVPMARFGDIHVLNCLYSCPGTVGINPRMHSAFLVEGNWFEAGVRSFCQYKVKDTPPRAYVWRDNHSEDGEEMPAEGEVSMPYPYTVADPAEARQAVLSYAGPTLSQPLRISSR